MHQLVHEARDVQRVEVPCQGRARTERPPRQCSGYDVVRQLFRRIFLAVQVQDIQKFKVTPGPTVHIQYRNCIFLFREERGKVHTIRLTVVVFDVSDIVRKGVVVRLHFTPEGGKKESRSVLTQVRASFVYVFVKLSARGEGGRGWRETDQSYLFSQCSLAFFIHS